MSGHNRYLRGNIMEVLAPVRGKHTIEAGDFCYYDSGDSNYCTSFAQNKTAGVTRVDLFDYFAGVAMEGSPSGTTNNITVATAGVFRYPLIYDSAVTIGSVVSATSTTAGVGTTAQLVSNSIAEAAGGCTVPLGVIIKTNTSAVSFVDFQLRTMAGMGAVTVSAAAV